MKYNLHYGDVRGDVLQPTYYTTPAAVKINKFWIVKSIGSSYCAKEQKIADSVQLSLFMISNQM